VAYSKSRQPKNPVQTPVPSNPSESLGIKDVWDTIRAPFAGMIEGLTGGDLTYEENLRKKRGEPVPRRNWLQRVRRPNQRRTYPRQQLKKR